MSPVRRRPAVRAPRRSRRLALLSRRRWSNHTGNQGVDPVAIVPAAGEDDLIAAVAKARENGLTVRAVGSGHSWSDVSLTTGYLVTPQGMTGVAHVEMDLLRRDVADAGRLVCVRSGTTLRELNAWLDREGLALIQMGGYDGQTLVGATATSTHGSGVTFPPLQDYVRSIDLIDGTGRRRRIEPEEGITDPAAFAARRPEWELTQEDGWFDAALCAMGCMGLIVAVVLEVRARFRLTEVRRIGAWKDVREELRDGALAQHEHYEVYVNPYARAGPGSNRCIVTTRAEEHGRGASRHRPLIPELLGNLPWLTAAFVRVVCELAPALIPRLIDSSLAAIVSSGYTNASYRVFNIGSANNLWAYSGEMAVPTAGERHIAAVETVIEVAERYRRDGDVYHTAFVALRFVAPSRAALSMMHARETMTIELIQLVDTDGGMEIIAAHEEALAPLAVRPHWGQVNTLACAELLAARYPALMSWQSVRRQLDPDGVFASPFSKRVGFTPLGASSAVGRRGGSAR